MPERGSQLYVSFLYSLICLLGGKNGSDASTCTNHSWRPHLDLEHNTCYSPTNHWSALFDGEMKFIFNVIILLGWCGV